MSRPTLELPADEAKRLKGLREAGPSALPKLRARVSVLRDAGWSLAAVGTPLGANRSTTRMWQLGADPKDVKASIQEFGKPVLAPPRRSSVKVIRMYPDVPESERAELVRLAESVRKIRGWTPANSQERKDAEKFEKLLRNYKQRGVPVKRMAEHIGITHHAVAARLDRAEAKRNDVKVAS